MCPDVFILVLLAPLHFHRIEISSFSGTGRRFTGKGGSRIEDRRVGDRESGIGDRGSGIEDWLKKLENKINK